MTFSQENRRMALQAEEINFHPNEGGCAVAGFRGAGDNYLIVTLDLAPSEQDRSLGMDAVHIELNDQHWSCYGGIGAVSVYPRRLVIELNERGAKNLDESKISVEFELPAERRSQLRTVLGVIFDGMPSLVDLG